MSNFRNKQKTRSGGQPQRNTENISGGRITKWLHLGTLVDDKYLIEAELGYSSSGIVYRACDKRVYDRPVILKVFHHEFVEDEELLKIFRHESEILSRVDHPAIVKVYDIGNLNDGKPYLVMEFVKGETLCSRIRPGGVSFDFATQILHQLGEALETAHTEGIYHRNLKPEDIILHKLSSGTEHAKIIDFGIAKIPELYSATSETVCKLDEAVLYMSPEQLEKGQISTAGNIFSLAVIAYELLTGTRPFNFDSYKNQSKAIAQVLIMQQKGVYIRPKDIRPRITEAAQNAIIKALSYEIDNRQKSIKEFTEELVPALITVETPSFQEGSQPSSPLILKRKQFNLIGESEKSEHLPTKESIPVLKIIGFSILIALVIGGAIVWPKFFRKDVTTPPEIVNTEKKDWRTFTYWMVVQKNPKLYPNSKPFRLPGDIIFEQGYRARLYLNSQQSGYLYILNEGPITANGLPQYIMIFPKTTLNGSSAQISANQEIQIPNKNWLIFDSEEGTEKFWFICSARSIQELEAVKSVVNQRDKGVISNLDHIKLVQSLLARFSKQKTEIERDDENKMTIVRSRDEIFVNLLKIEHH
jgi:serine/threonine protein kinase